MKQFIIYILSFSLIVVITFICILSLADGRTDAFYLRFTTPVQSNLIIGTSRAAQGLQPAVFNAKFGDRKFYNYAFTVAQSPFGSVYLNSIKKKLDTTVKDAIFIVTVDPWSICSKTKNPNDSSHFRENALALQSTTHVNTKPNYQYLIHQLSGKYHKILFPFASKSFLHDDGWLEISLKMDASSIANRTKRRLKTYKETVIPSHNFSTLRLEYLIKTIQFLKRYGSVYLVRLPVSVGMFDLEMAFMPDFDSKIQRAISLSDGYNDLTLLNETYVYTDGNHLYKNSGKEVSNFIADWILTIHHQQ